MLSEEFDKKIRDAAGHHHPTYDENAWKGMKKLLDKHLPEEKEDRRRIIFFLLLFLLLGGGAWYFFGQPSRKTGNGKATETIIAAQPSGNSKPANEAVTENKDERGEPVNREPQKNNVVVITPGGENKDNKDLAGTAPSLPAPDISISNLDGSTPKTKKQPGKTKPANKTGPADVAGNDKMVNNKPPVAPVPSPLNPDDVKKDNGNEVANPVVVPSQKDKLTAQPAANDKKPGDDIKAYEPASVKTAADKPASVKTAADKPTSAEATADEPVAKKDEAARVTAKKEKPISKKKSSFSISVSAGPDVSFTGNDGLGRMKLLGGAGIGYTYKEKFTLRTGFYAARKIYTSSPENYNAPANFYTWYPNMQRIDADCKVYEIPLNLSYHFSKTARQGFFATAGLSSYLMKRETYDYYYKYIPTGPTLQREYSFYNENDHFFSVLNLGAGYQRSIGKRISITAEPYFKIPLRGVGYGKVKLNSAGVLFSLSVKPFQKAGKK
jgi:hypothetical protein